MSWDLDAMSVLPESWQDDVSENFSPEYLAEKLSDYIVLLQSNLNGKQVVSNEAIKYLHDNHADAYREFYKRV